ncbi:MAG: pyridoxal-phosphate dependent enzyme [Candidatus Aminicenantales bacterium]|nr:hypothetical protein [Acidobacteriota bacterium]
MNVNKSYQSPVEAIGSTPLVKLNKITAELSSQAFAKFEFLNPMGSIKDRIPKWGRASGYRS